MTSKEYLKQIEYLENEAENLKFELDIAESTMNCISAVRYDKIKVQNGTLPHEAGFEKQVDRVYELRESLICKMAEINLKRHEIISVLSHLPNLNQSKLLFKLYVEHKPIGKCAEELNYSYDYTLELHKKALRAVKVPEHAA